MIHSVRERGEAVRKFILAHVEKHPTDVARVASEKFGISRQAANKHMQNLVREGSLSEAGKTKARTYRLRPLLEWWHSYDLVPDLSEDQVWREDVSPLLDALPRSVLNIWHYAFTEMFNNAIDHSDGKHVGVYVEKTAVKTRLLITDDGVGIFKKICAQLGLEDERHAVLELAKGKLTTDPTRHTGEGIFFTSRVVDDFTILAGDVTFNHKFEQADDWILQHEHGETGTTVALSLGNHTSRTLKRVFDTYASPGGDYGFTKTVVPVRLARYGEDQLVSRSQAKRLLARVDRFKTVVLDFAGVKDVGQAFADEAFRVFANGHPEVELIPANTSEAIRRMIQRVKAH